MAPSDPPSHRYYRWAVGEWSGRLHLRITDWRAFRRSRAPLFDRLGMLATAALVACTGPLRMTTTVRFGTRPGSRDETGAVVHTTRISQFGFALFRSIEVLDLHADGRTLTMRGVQSQAPFLGSGRRVEDHGEVDPDAQGARYTLAWMGDTMDQVTRIVPEGLELTQTTPWMEGRVVLRRT